MAEVSEATGNSREHLADLRLRFLTQGEELCRELLNPAGGTLDLEAVRRATHTWAGLGGMLGFDEVTAQARLIERAMRDHEAVMEQTTAGLLVQRYLFEILLACEPATLVPQHS